MCLFQTSNLHPANGSASVKWKQQVHKLCLLYPPQTSPGVAGPCANGITLAGGLQYFPVGFFDSTMTFSHKELLCLWSPAPPFQGDDLFLGESGSPPGRGAGWRRRPGSAVWNPGLVLPKRGVGFATRDFPSDSAWQPGRGSSGWTDPADLRPGGSWWSFLPQGCPSCPWALLPSGLLGQQPCSARVAGQGSWLILCS